MGPFGRNQLISWIGYAKMFYYIISIKYQKIGDLFLDFSKVCQHLMAWAKMEQITCTLDQILNTNPRIRATMEIKDVLTMMTNIRGNSKFSEFITPIPPLVGSDY